MPRNLAFVATLAALTLGACSSGSSSAPTPGTAAQGSGASTSDPRVRSFLGQVPPELGADLAWVMRVPTPLASLQGSVVFLQFAFPT